MHPIVEFSYTCQRLSTSRLSLNKSIIYASPCYHFYAFMVVEWFLAQAFPPFPWDKNQVSTCPFSLPCLNVSVDAVNAVTSETTTTTTARPFAYCRSVGCPFPSRVPPQRLVGRPAVAHLLLPPQSSCRPLPQTPARAWAPLRVLQMVLATPPSRLTTRYACVATFEVLSMLQNHLTSST